MDKETIKYYKRDKKLLNRPLLNKAKKYISKLIKNSYKKSKTEIS